MAPMRRFYNRLAAAFREERPPEDTPEYRVWLNLMHSVATVLGKEGRFGFNRDRFEEECTTESVGAAGYRTEQ